MLPVSEPRIVDSHVHVWQRHPRFAWSDDPRTLPARDALPETLLQLMRENRVEQTVIVQVIYYRWDCRYAAEAVQAHPGKFAGVCRVDPESASAPAELERWVGAGLRGVRLSPAANATGDWIHDRAAMDAIWGSAAQLRVPMCVLCPSERIPDVERVIERWDDALDVCIDHMADSPIDRPDALQKLLALARHERVYVKLSHLWSLSREPYPYRDTHEQVRRIHDVFGPRRLMWGTDWPLVEQYCGYARALALFRDEIEFFNDDDRRWILGQTARRLWPLPAGD
ncbi:MAG TPA: amidohydrolase family protein [Pirellulales bacterium]|nr:amidohydrolase family protein [Pirellulales bacterium]